MKILLTILIIAMMISCGPRTGTHPENDPEQTEHTPVIETCVVQNISLSNGNYQIFIVHVKNKRKSYDISMICTKILSHIKE